LIKNWSLLNYQIHILHPHGYLPFNEDGDIERRHSKTIILSSFEYMDNYMKEDRFAYKSLYKQLNKTNLLIGNSISDFQEQMVLRKHYHDFPSNYSYLLTEKSGNDFIDVYRMLYFFDIGIITLYFESFNDLPKYLKKLKEKIK